MNSQTSKITIIASVIVVLVVALYISNSHKSVPSDIPLPPIVELPVTNVDSWSTTTDPVTGITYRYPKTLDATYVREIDWPPTIQLESKPFECVEAGLEAGRAGITEKRSIDLWTICRTKVSEGAAGSTYTQYAYAFPALHNSTMYLTFTIRTVQCGNYDEPQKSECEVEQKLYNEKIIDFIAAEIAGQVNVGLNKRT